MPSDSVNDEDRICNDIRIIKHSIRKQFRMDYRVLSWHITLTYDEHMAATITDHCVQLQAIQKLCLTNIFIRQKFCTEPTTCCRSIRRNHPQLRSLSSSTMAKAIGSMWFAASIAIPINNFSRYLPLRKVPSTETTGLQCDFNTWTSSDRRQH